MSNTKFNIVKMDMQGNEVTLGFGFYYQQALACLKGFRTKYPDDILILKGIQ